MSQRSFIKPSHRTTDFIPMEVLVRAPKNLWSKRLHSHPTPCWDSSLAGKF